MIKREMCPIDCSTQCNANRSFVCLFVFLETLTKRKFSSKRIFHRKNRFDRRFLDVFFYAAATSADDRVSLLSEENDSNDINEQKKKSTKSFSSFHFDLKTQNNEFDTLSRNARFSDVEIVDSNGIQSSCSNEYLVRWFSYSIETFVFFFVSVSF